MIQSAQFLKALRKDMGRQGKGDRRERDREKIVCLFMSVGRVKFSPEISRLSAIPKEMDGNFIFTLNNLGGCVGSKWCAYV